jgi:hypothetical protein
VLLKNGMLPRRARRVYGESEEWCLGLTRRSNCARGGGCAWRRRYGGRIRAAASTTKLLIVAEDKNTDPAGFALAPFFIRRELQARFGTITQIL